MKVSSAHNKGVPIYLSTANSIDRDFNEAVESAINQEHLTDEQAIEFLNRSLKNYDYEKAIEWRDDWKVNIYIVLKINHTIVSKQSLLVCLIS